MKFVMKFLDKDLHIKIERSWLFGKTIFCSYYIRELIKRKGFDGYESIPEEGGFNIDGKTGKIYGKDYSKAVFEIIIKKVINLRKRGLLK